MKLSKLAFWIATWFGCGLAPRAPGTVGSVAAVAIAWALHWSEEWLIAAAILSFPIFLWAAGRVARDRALTDPQIVVADEVIGQWITLAGATAYNWKTYVLGFILFRVFDILKPPPARQLERLHGGLGIVADDMMAGLYAAIVLYGFGRIGIY